MIAFLDVILGVLWRIIVGMILVVGILFFIGVLLGCIDHIKGHKE